MKDYTLKKNSPSEETLSFLKAFARIYHPAGKSADTDTEVTKSVSDFNTAFC